MQRDARDRILARRFATRKQEVQSLYLSGFDDHQITGLTGIHRRNVSKYVRETSTPRAVPRKLLTEEMQYAVTTVGAPRYGQCVSPPLSVEMGVSNVIFAAQDAIDAKKRKKEEMGISEDEDEDVEHYYDRVLERLKRGNEDESD